MYKIDICKKGIVILKFYDDNGSLFVELNYAKEFFSGYEKHSHDRLCIAGLIEGKISTEFHQKSIQYIRPNQLIVFNPTQVHVSKNSDIKSYDYFTFHFDTRWLKKLSLNNNIYFEDNIINNKVLYDKFINIAKDVVYNKNHNIHANLKSFMSDILQLYATSHVPKDKEKYILYDVQKYILVNIEENITLDDIACKLGYSKEHIIRIFKKEFGLSPHAFLMNEKVNKAREILLDGSNQNISQVAVKLGFYDQSHLNKFFKRSFGITPNEYKKYH